MHKIYLLVISEHGNLKIYYLLFFMLTFTNLIKCVYNIDMKMESKNINN